MAWLNCCFSSLRFHDFGARGDGKTDDTSAFQSALRAAAEQGGKVVVAPAGEYRLNGTLTIPAGVTLEGAWRGPHTSQLSRGTTLLAYAGRDQEDGDPLITLRAGATLKGITVYYPEQKVSEIHPYPWTIQGRGQHYNVIAGVCQFHGDGNLICNTDRKEWNVRCQNLFCVLQVHQFVQRILLREPLLQRGVRTFYIATSSWRCRLVVAGRFYRIQISNNERGESDLFDQRAKPVCVAAANLHQGYIAMVYFREMLSYEVWNQHSLGWTFYQDCSICEKEVTMNSSKIYLLPREGSRARC